MIEQKTNGDLIIETGNSGRSTDNQYLKLLRDGVLKNTLVDGDVNLTDIVYKTTFRVEKEPMSVSPAIYVSTSASEDGVRITASDPANIINRSYINLYAADGSADLELNATTNVISSAKNLDFRNDTIGAFRIDEVDGIQMFSTVDLGSYVLINTDGSSVMVSSAGDLSLISATDDIRIDGLSQITTADANFECIVKDPVDNKLYAMTKDNFKTWLNS